MIQNRNIALCIILSIVTCGIYGFFWAYKMGEKIDIIKTNNGGVAGNSSLMFLLLQIFGLGIINYCIMQTELNNVANV